MRKINKSKIQLIEINQTYYSATNSADRQFLKFLGTDNDSQSQETQFMQTQFFEGYSLIKDHQILLKDVNLSFQQTEIKSIEEIYVEDILPSDHVIKQQKIIAEKKDQNSQVVFKKVKKTDCQNSYYKNFLILLSVWLWNYFQSCLNKGIILKQTFDRFEQIVDPVEQHYRKSTRKFKRGKIYINLKKLSKLFDNETLKPHLSNFLDGYFLRYLMTSKTKNKTCLLRFLPILKQGLMQGQISFLR